MTFNEAFVKYMAENFDLDVNKLPGETEDEFKARLHRSWEMLSPEQKDKLRAFLLS